MTKIKRLLKKLTQGESGQGALGIVLILVLLGGFILPPLLSFMGTGLKAGQMHEVKTEGYYAADSGIEDATWKIKNTYINPFLAPELAHYSLLSPVNKMKVYVDEVKEHEVISENKILYTIKSIAKQDETIKAEIVAEIIGEYKGLPGEQGVGDWKGEGEQQVVTALTTVDWKTILCGIKHGSGAYVFFAGGDGGSETALEYKDIMGVQVNSGHAWECLDGSSSWDIGAQDFGDIHYVPYDPAHLDDTPRLFMSLPQPAKVMGKEFDDADIIEIKPGIGYNALGDIILEPVDLISTPEEPWCSMNDYFHNVAVTAFCLLPNGHVVFSVGQDATTKDGLKFKKCQLIELIPPGAEGGPWINPEPYLDVGKVLEGHDPHSQNIIVTAVTPLVRWDEDLEKSVVDGRLLLTFDQDVIGSDGETIFKGDIALWTPQECASCTTEEGCPGGCPYPPNDPYDPYDPTKGCINCHINMHATGQDLGPSVKLQIKSWNIEE